MSRRAWLLMLVTLPVLVIGSLYLRTLVRRVFFEAAQPADASARARLTQAALESSTGASQSVVLYFPSYQEGKLRAESRPLSLAASDSDRIRQVVLALVEGSRQGSGQPLAAGAEVRAVFLTADGTAYLDFSSAALAGFTPGIESETLAVYSIVDSLAANVPAVKRVKILVQGQEVDTLDGHVDLTNDFVPDPTRIATAAP
ncbi:MAG TPA: GerMN domain-containing protein [Terriglobia bacterium]|nr:GerMN domain-containing protein [Terriglobia bacterium]